MRGKFITFEGADGAGKTTQVQHLVTILEEAGFTVKRTREPGGTENAECIRDLLLTKRWTKKAEMFLFAAARAEHVETFIKPELEKGTIIVCDRFVDSSYAYQGGGHGLSVLVEDVERITLEGFEPDYTLFFDVPLEVSLQRMAGRQDNNIFDAMVREFKVNTYKAYRKRFLNNPHRMVRIDAMRTVADIHEQIRTWVHTVLIPQVNSEAFETSSYLQQQN